jgi:hypothetical protein
MTEEWISPTIQAENEKAWLETMESLAAAAEGLEVTGLIVSTPETDHILPRFRVRWAEDAHTDGQIRAQEKAMKALGRLLKRDKMTISHTDDAGFQVYHRAPDYSKAGGPRRRR